MQAYRYKGVDLSGAKVSGEIQAASMEEAERKLAAKDVTIIAVFPLTLRSKSTSEAPRSGDKPAKKAKEAEVAAALRDLAVMSETGVPFVEALEAVASSSSSPIIKEGFHRLRLDIVQGAGLADAMRSVQGLFPEIVCELVQVAEEGGRLDRALHSAATYVERSAELRRKVMNAMLYPVVLTGISFLAMVVLFCFVLPKFGGIFKSMKADVPATTTFLLGVGEYLRSHPLYVLGSVAALIFVIRSFIKTPAGKATLSRAILKAPLIGDLSRKLALSRSFQSIGTLLSCNVSLMAALEHGARVSGNSLISNALTSVRDSVEHGATLADSMSSSNAFTPMLVQVVSVGERTGRLAPLIAAHATHLEEEVDARIKALVGIVEPVMIALMGGVVGFITVSIISPIYSVVQNIK